MVIIAVTGIALIPFLHYLVQAPDVKESLTLLYVLYLLNTLVSYVYVYKKSVLIADQKDYIVSIYTQFFNIVMNVLQIIFLLLTRNFIVYCLIHTVCVLLNNLTCAKKAEKLYPALHNRTINSISVAEKKSLMQDVKGLLLTKVASVTFSGTDNLFISAFIGIEYVGILSNYLLLLSTFNGIMNKIFYSVTASIGNLAVTGTPKQMENIVKKMFFLNTAVYGYLCLGTVLLVKQFVTEIWLTPQYTLSQTVILIMVVELFLRSIHYPLYTTRTAMGCFSQYRIWFAIMAGVNILLDFWWIKPFGIAGLFAATLLCRAVTYWIDLWVVYHQQWKISVWNYLTPLAIWGIFLVVTGGIMTWLLQMIPYGGYLGFGIKIGIVSVLYPILVYLCFGRTEEFAYYKHMVYKFLPKKERI